MQDPKNPSSSSSTSTSNSHSSSSSANSSSSSSSSSSSNSLKFNDVFRNPEMGPVFVLNSLLSARSKSRLGHTNKPNNQIYGFSAEEREHKKLLKFARDLYLNMTDSSTAKTEISWSHPATIADIGRILNDRAGFKCLAGGGNNIAPFLYQMQRLYETTEQPVYLEYFQKAQKKIEEYINSLPKSFNFSSSKVTKKQAFSSGVGFWDHPPASSSSSVPDKKNDVSQLVIPGDKFQTNGQLATTCTTDQAMEWLEKFQQYFQNGTAVLMFHSEGLGLTEQQQINFNDDSLFMKQFYELSRALETPNMFKAGDCDSATLLKKLKGVKESMQELINRMYEIEQIAEMKNSSTLEPPSP